MGLVMLPLCAEMRMSVDQLVQFIRSSVQLKHPDKQVAQYLRGVKLTQKLDGRTVEELQSMGVGAKTAAALSDLRDESSNLPPAPVQPKQAAPTPVPGPDSVEQSRILDEVRAYALNYTKQLPNFLCTQVTRRWYDPSGLEFWRMQDVITTRLSYFDQHEDYKVVLVNNQPVETSMERLGGAISTGEFGSHMREIFSPKTQTRFEWERWATLRGRRTYVFSYLVDQEHSTWHILYDHSLDIVPGYRGLVYIDKENSRILRITMDPVDIPPTFPVQQASTVLDYDYAKIADQQYLLPLRAVVRSRVGKLLSKNEVEFRLYRKFGTEATIKFEDTPEPLPEEKTKEKP